MRTTVFHRLALVALLGLGWIIHPIGSAVHEARHLVNGDGHNALGHALTSRADAHAPTTASAHDHAHAAHHHGNAHGHDHAHSHDHHDHHAAGDAEHPAEAPCFMPPGCSMSAGWTGAPPLPLSPAIDRLSVVLPARAADEALLPPADRAGHRSRAPPADNV